MNTAENNTLATRGIAIRMQHMLLGKSQNSLYADLFSVGVMFDVYANISFYLGNTICANVCATQHAFFIDKEGNDLECRTEPMSEEDMLAYRGDDVEVEFDLAEFKKLSDEEQITKLMPLAEQIFAEAEKVANILAENSHLEAGLIL